MIDMKAETASGAKPAISFWHLCVDDHGASRFIQRRLSDFELKAVGPIAPQWNELIRVDPKAVVFTVQPVGWVGEWHENPAPQWIAVLSGRWWIEAMDGTRIEQGPGEFSFGGDQDCVEIGGRKGHRSGAIGDDPAVLMTVQLAADPFRLQPVR